MKNQESDDAAKSRKESDDNSSSETELNSRAELEERAKRGSKKRFRQALAKVRDAEPEPFDEL